MGLRDDMDALEYHIARGQGQAYLQGTLTPEQQAQANQDHNRAPLDESINARGYDKIIKRGD